MGSGCCFSNTSAIAAEKLKNNYSEDGEVSDGFPLMTAKVTVGAELYRHDKCWKLVKAVDLDPFLIHSLPPP